MEEEIVYFNLDTDTIQYKQENRYSKVSYNNRKKAAYLDSSVMPCLMRFPELDKISFIKYGFSTRLGGVSKGCLGTMNLSFSRGDKKEQVLENYKRICHSIGVSEWDAVLSDQVHDTKIHVVAEKDCGRGIRSDDKLKNIDGLITNVPKLPLVTFYADCVPLYFVDIKKRAIGLSHSGWRGTVRRMGEVTVEAMKKEFNCNPNDIIAVIGPSICADCYEVSEDVAEAFRKSFKEEQWNTFLQEKPNHKFQLDLWLSNRYILEEAGIPAENISISEVCTCCNSSLLYSHRATNGKRGNLAAFLSIK